MRDEDDGLVQLGLQPLHLGLQVVAHVGVNRTEGLIHQQDRRVGGQRTRHPDTLLLASGELRGIPGRQLRIEPHPLQHFERGFPRRAPGFTAQHRHGGHVVDHPLVGHQTGVLNDVSDAQPQLDRVHCPDIRPIDGQQSRGEIGHPVDHPHRRGLAASRRPHEHSERSLVHMHVEIVDRSGPVRVLLGDVLEGNQAVTLPRVCRSPCPSTISVLLPWGRHRCCRTPRH
ncbi:Uncharacterised protein [Mycobacteroides abscessus subsp. massiliense]|nr:Uncharacterised protein [Mycobacteroides abscessus subsp. massiliense]